MHGIDEVNKMTKFTIACLLFFISGECYGYMMATKNRKKENIAFALGTFFCCCGCYLI